MARVDWVRRRLENWARWCALSGAGALGYPRQTTFARLAPSGGRSDDAVPIMALDASEMDDAVKALQFTHSHLYLLLTLTYAQGLPRHQVAKRMCRAESTVSGLLGDADRALAAVLDAKREKSFTP